MKISKTNQFIFIHIPKTGGTSITKALPGTGHASIQLPHWHVTANQIKNKTTNYNEYYSFAFVRNPWDRLYSIYKYNNAFVNQYKKLPQYKTHGMNYFFECDFKTWLIEKNTWGGWDKYKEYKTEQRQQQYEYLINKDNNIIVSDIYKFENISTEYDKICQKLNIPAGILGNYEKSSRSKDYHYAYDDEMIEFIYKHHNNDIEKFDYVF